MVRFSEKEIKFVQERDLGRVATVSPTHWPQVTPVIHVCDGKNIYFATDYTTKKYKNLRKNDKIAIVFDVFGRQPQGILVVGKAKIFDRGKEFLYGFDLLQKRHVYYRANPFKEGEAPIIKIMPTRKVS